MQRFGRILLNVLTVASLLICVAAVGMWARSYWWTDYARYERHGGGYAGPYPFAISHRGSVQWKLAAPTWPFHDGGWFHFSQGPAEPFHFNVDDDLGRGIDRWERPGGAVYGRIGAWEHRWGGFACGAGVFQNSGIRTDPRRQYRYWYAETPHWALACVLAALPAARLRRVIRHRRRARAGLCPACAYDCRATPDRCPECGTTVPTGPDSVLPSRL